jgi:hypothetical protein
VIEGRSYAQRFTPSFIGSNRSCKREFGKQDFSIDRCESTRKGDVLLKGNIFLNKDQIVQKARTFARCIRRIFTAGIRANEGMAKGTKT